MFGGSAARTKDRKSYKIGSKNINKVNFGKEDHFFHLDDRLQMTKKGVKDFIDPDILTLKKPGWNTSSSVVPTVRSDHQKHLFNVTNIFFLLE